MKLAFPRKRPSLRRLLAFLALLVVIALAIVGFISQKRMSRVASVKPLVNPLFSELPYPDYPLDNHLRWQKNTIVVTRLDERVSVEKSLPVYKLESSPSQTVSASSLAEKLGFEELEENGEQLSARNERGDFLLIEASTMFWRFKRKLRREKFVKLTQAMVKERALGFLRERGLFSPQLEKASVKEEFYRARGAVLEEADSFSEADFVRFNFFLAEGNFPILSGADQEAVLSVTATVYGEIFTIDYRVPNILWESLGFYPSLKWTDALRKLKEGGGTVVSARDFRSQYFNSLGSLAKFTVKDARLIYFADAKNGFLIPTWEFSGEAIFLANDANQQYASLTVWLPAISFEWLK